MHETFQYSGWADRWTVMSYSSGYHGAGGYGEAKRISNSPGGYTYSKALWIHAYADGVWYGGSFYHGCGTATVENITPELIEYLSFVAYQAGGSIIFLDDEGNTLGSFGTGTVGLYEFYMIGNSMYAIVNGDSKGIVFTSTKKPYYIRFHVGLCNSASHDVYLTIDDLNTEQKAGTIAIGIEPESHVITEYDNDEIDVSWHVTTIPWDDFKDSEYAIEVVNLNTGETIDRRIVKRIPVGYEIDPPYGMVKYIKSELFGKNYAPYLFNLTKNGEVLTFDYLIYRELPPPVSCPQSFKVVTMEVGKPSKLIEDTLVEVRDYLSNEFVDTCKTLVSGKCEIELDTSRIYVANASKKGYGCHECRKVFGACEAELELSLIPQPTTQKVAIIDSAGYLGYVIKKEEKETILFGAEVDKLTIATLFVNSCKAELSIAGEKIGEVEAGYNEIEAKAIYLGEIPTEGKNLEIELRCKHVGFAGLKYAACATIVGTKG